MIARFNKYIILNNSYFAYIKNESFKFIINIQEVFKLESVYVYVD